MEDCRSLTIIKLSIQYNITCTYYYLHTRRITPNLHDFNYNYNQIYNYNYNYNTIQLWLQLTHNLHDYTYNTTFILYILYKLEWKAVKEVWSTTYARLPLPYHFDGTALRTFKCSREPLLQSHKHFIYINPIKLLWS